MTQVNLNQHCPKSHAAKPAACIEGAPRERVLAQWMSSLNLTGHGA